MVDLPLQPAIDRLGEGIECGYAHIRPDPDRQRYSHIRRLH
ncbi:hypothetical protein [Mycobacterium shigaense]|nr:hypothetical protein [Mycobacterium shigaense]MEA1124187.1 hypothetical protein [Mycobacterium shigaense]